MTQHVRTNVSLLCITTYVLLMMFQTGTSEQFEQVVFSVWPVRAAITLHNLSHRVRGHIAPTVATTLPALTLLTLVACRRWIL
jgi:hypothetical protein